MSKKKIVRRKRCARCQHKEDPSKLDEDGYCPHCLRILNAQMGTIGLTIEGDERKEDE